METPKQTPQGNQPIVTHSTLADAIGGIFETFGKP